MADFTRVDPAVLDRLRKFDSPTVCNVLELFDIRPRTAGYMDGRIQACYPKLPPMVGYACTATFRAGDPPRSGDVYAGLGKQVEAIAGMPGPAVVVFQDLDDPMTSATFGEVMCTTYKAFGCSGLPDSAKKSAGGWPVLTSFTAMQCNATIYDVAVNSVLSNPNHEVVFKTDPAEVP